MNAPVAPLQLQVQLADGRLQAIDVRRVRPPVAALLRGRAPEHAVAVLPRLFSLCTHAHAIAAALAWAAARGDEPALLGATIAPAQSRLLRAEALREHLWRLLLDWPAWLGRGPGPLRDTHAALHRALATLRGDDAGGARRIGAEVERLLMPLCACLPVEGETGAAGEEGAEALAAAWATAPAKALQSRLSSAGDRGEPSAVLQAVLVELLCLEQVAAPQSLADALPALGLTDASWPPAEAWRACTGPAAMRASQPLVAALWSRHRRLAARFVAKLLAARDLARSLADTAEGPSAHAPLAALAHVASTAPGEAVARVNTARGMLTHAVRLDARGRIDDYRIVAPTDVQFHPQGGFALECQSWCVADAVSGQRLLHALVLALDPCVPHALTLHIPQQEAHHA